MNHLTVAIELDPYYFEKGVEFNREYLNNFKTELYD